MNAEQEHVQFLRRCARTALLYARVDLTKIIAKHRANYRDSSDFGDPCGYKIYSVLDAILAEIEDANERI